MIVCKGTSKYGNSSEIRKKQLEWTILELINYNIEIIFYFISYVRYMLFMPYQWNGMKGGIAYCVERMSYFAEQNE